MELKVVKMDGKASGKITLSDELFNCEYNESLIHQVVVAQLANKRQGTQSALTRAEVSGGGIKPFRQKGTGHARQGSIRAPQHVGGGIVFAKKPRSFSQKINKGMKDVAFFSAISEKIRQNDVTVLDKFEAADAKTKTVAGCVDALKLNGTVLFVVGEHDSNVVKASNNIPSVAVIEARMLNVYDVVATKNVVFTKDALTKIEEAAK